ncbi:MAG: B12-binding domain-containing radical SAM protein [Planctomycetes bacterium]|nr:B12-binding domain-containing radical SAM protein [Planctomycetota bacterium]
MRNAILVSSTSYDVYKMPPLGIMTVATMLKQRSIEPILIDLPMAENAEKDISNFFRVISERVNTDTIFIGFSTVCNTFPRSLYLASLIKKLYPDIPIVFGGPQASSCAAYLIKKYDFIDLIICGEIEAIFDNFMDSILSKNFSSSTGILARDSIHLNNNPVMAPTVPIDSIPRVDFETYSRLDPGEPIPIEVGRGCPYGCTFCSTKDFFRRRFRLKSPDSIVGDISRIVAESGVKRFTFIHDMLTTNKKLLAEVCRLMIKSGLNVKWTCMARVDMVDEQLLALMSDAGCWHVYFGLESGSQRIQKIIDKNLNVEKGISTIKLALDMGYGVATGFIIGFPQETPDDVIDTINAAFRLRQMGIKKTRIDLLTPLAGTELTNGYFSNLRYDGFMHDKSLLNYLTSWEEKEIKSDPYLFSSFYYIPNENITRDTYKFLFWLLFYNDYFTGFFMDLWDKYGDDTGRMIFDWVQGEGSEMFGKVIENKQDLPKYISHLASALMHFCGSHCSDPDYVVSLKREILADLCRV